MHGVGSHCNMLGGHLGWVCKPYMCSNMLVGRMDVIKVILACY